MDGLIDGKIRLPTYLPYLSRLGCIGRQQLGHRRLILFLCLSVPEDSIYELPELQALHHPM